MKKSNSEKFEVKGQRIYAIDLYKTHLNDPNHDNNIIHDLVFCEETVEQMVEERVKNGLFGDEIREAITESILEQLSPGVGDLMDGYEFLELEEGNSISDYDGTLAAVYVNGYKSNLGLLGHHMCQGHLMLTPEAFADFCEHHDVKVEWANK